MKNVIPAILLIATMAGSVSCKKEVIGEGPVTTESRILTGFTGIDLQMNGNVYYKNEPVWKVEITAKQSIHSILETKVTGGKLVIRYSNGKTYDEDESIRINVSGPGVNRFELNTSGSIYGLNTIQQTDLFLRSSGSGSILLQNIEANNIVAESIVSGRIIATGGSIVNGQIKTDASAKIDFSGVAANNSSYSPCVLARKNGGPPSGGFP